MKRRISLLIVAVLTLAFASAASANVFFENPNTELDVKFKGVEYAFTQEEGTVITDYVDAAVPGVQMSGIFYVTTVQATDGHGNPLGLPDLYNNSMSGAYIGYLSGLTVASVEQTSQDGSKFTIYFTGGTLDWYYSETISTSDIATAQWSEELGGYVDQDGDLIALSDATLFASYVLVYENGYSGYADVTVNQDGSLTANFHTYGDIVMAEGLEEWMVEYFDNNKYSDGHDIVLDATLKWDNNGDDYFKVNDPALLTTAATPEPGTFILMSLGLLLTALYVGKQRKGTM